MEARQQPRAEDDECRHDSDIPAILQNLTLTRKEHNKGKLR